LGGTKHKVRLFLLKRGASSRKKTRGGGNKKRVSQGEGPIGDAQGKNCCSPFLVYLIEKLRGGKGKGGKKKVWEWGGTQR